MINISYILPTSRSAKRLLGYAKKLLASNLAFAIIALPLNSLPATTSSGSLLIPQEKLDTAFNIANEAKAENLIQIPVQFTYMSQTFTPYHPGIDLATKFGTAIRPIKDGVVEFAGYSTYGYGNEIVIDHGGGLESLYAHLSKIAVKAGDSVNTNSIIGLVGSTGHSTGPHLHLEIHREGKAINPLTILPAIRTNLLTSIQQ